MKILIEINLDMKYILTKSQVRNQNYLGVKKHKF